MIPVSHAAVHPSVCSVDDLVIQMTPQIRTRIQQAVANPADVDDLVQCVIVHLWQSYERYDPQHGPIEAWVAGITRHVIRSFLRTLYRHPPFVQDSTVYLDHAPDPNPLPLETLVATEGATELHAAICRLPQPMQDLVHAAFFHGMTHRQLAMQRNLPLGTVKTLLRRAQIILRSRLSAHVHED